MRKIGSPYVKVSIFGFESVFQGSSHLCISEMLVVRRLEGGGRGQDIDGLVCVAAIEIMLLHVVPQGGHLFVSPQFGAFIK